MKRRGLAITFAILGALEGAAAWRDRAARARDDGSALVDTPLLDPDDLSRVQRIVVREKPQTRIVHREEGFEVRRVAPPDAALHETVLTRRADGGWIVSSYFDLEADRDAVGQTLRDLSQGRLLRFATGDPALMDDLGFEGTSVELDDAQGRPLRRIELGRQDGGEAYQLVRIDGRDAYVARHGAEIVGDPLAWIVTRLLPFGAREVRELELPFADASEPPLVLLRRARGAPLEAALETLPHGERAARRAETILEALLTEPMMLAVARDHPAAEAARANVARRVRLVLFDGRRYAVGYGLAPAGATALSAEARNEDLSVIVIESSDPEDASLRHTTKSAPVFERSATLGRLPRGRAALLAPETAPPSATGARP